MRRSISTKGSHSFTAEICRLLAMRLTGVEPIEVVAVGEPTRFCGEVTRYMNAEAKLVALNGALQQLVLTAEICRPANYVGRAAWHRATLLVTIGNREWVAYVKRDSSQQLVIDSLWPMRETTTS